MDPTLRSFLFGVAGSIATEVITANTAYRKRGRVPAYYRRPGFWVVRILLASLGGVFSVAFGTPNDVLALQVGVSTPLIVDRFARADQDGDGEPKDKQVEKLPEA